LRHFVEGNPIYAGDFPIHENQDGNTAGVKGPTGHEDAGAKLKTASFQIVCFPVVLHNEIVPAFQIRKEIPLVELAYIVRQMEVDVKRLVSECPVQEVREATFQEACQALLLEDMHGPLPVFVDGCILAIQWNTDPLNGKRLSSFFTQILYNKRQILNKNEEG
jgi:hypothetical protein